MIINIEIVLFRLICQDFPPNVSLSYSPSFFFIDNETLLFNIIRHQMHAHETSDVFHGFYSLA